MDLDARFKAALSIAEEASALALQYFEHRHELSVETKGLNDFVTEADREVEMLIRRRIAERFPEDGQLGEEKGSSRGSDQRALWVVDPIDGTTNFLRGLPHWGVQLAFLADEVVEMSVIHAPALREKYQARRGRGALCNDHALKVSPTAKLSESLLGMQSSRRTPAEPYTQRLAKLLAENIEYRRLGAASMMCTAVASGKLDCYFEAHLAPWDALPGMLLVLEAGGRSNEYLASDALEKGNALLVSNAALYETLASSLGVR